MENNTIYDDVFRTMMEKMPSLAVPLINEVFHTAYPQDVPIEQYRNEHHTGSGEIITDSCLGIGGKIYHIECQSTPDSTMSIRMIEYDFATALERVQKNGNIYEIDFPQSCVLYLRHGSRTPNELTVKVNFSDGETYTYHTPTVKVQDYTQDEIFQKELLFFLPFYIMRYERQLEEIGKSPEKLEKLAAEFQDIKERLSAIFESRDEAELYTRLLELMKEVSDYLLRAEPEARGRIGEIMGGKVLELETDRILERGFARGIEQGKSDLIVKMIQGGKIPAEEIAMYSGLTTEQILEIKNGLQSN